MTRIRVIISGYAVESRRLMKKKKETEEHCIILKRQRSASYSVLEAILSRNDVEIRDG